MAEESEAGAEQAAQSGDAVDAGDDAAAENPEKADEPPAQSASEGSTDGTSTGSDDGGTSAADSDDSDSDTVSSDASDSDDAAETDTDSDASDSDSDSDDVDSNAADVDSNSHDRVVDPTDEEATDGETVASDADENAGVTNPETPVTGELVEAEAPASDTDAEETAVESDAIVEEEPTDETEEAAAEAIAEEQEFATSPEMATEFEEAPSPDLATENDGIFGQGPEYDKEMPLTDHIEEMIKRLAVVLGIGGLATLLVYPGADILNALVGANIPSAADIINYLWNHNVPGAAIIEGRRPRLYGPLEFILTKLKVAGLAGLLAGLPVFVYETYRFMRPGLYPHERRYYLAAVPTSLVLGIVGMTFAHFVVLPAIFAYLTSYTEGTAVIAFGLRDTFNIVLVLMGYMAIVFQIPLFIMLAIMMGLVTRVWLEDKRLLFWGGFLGISFTFVAVDPTGMAPIIIAVTMIVLFEGTLALLRWTGN
ncbi:MAG: twin-arginine translocase subunit TatC [Halobacteriota archaeon]